MATMPIEVRPITGSLGAEIHGVDLGAELDDAGVATVRRALLDHCVVFFRDQRFDAARHKALARRFGDIFVHPNYATVVPDPEIIEIRREPGDVQIVGEEWHTDTTMMAEPPWAPSSTPSTCRPTAATRCSPASTSPTRRCPTA